MILIVFAKNTFGPSRELSSPSVDIPRNLHQNANLRTVFMHLVLLMQNTPPEKLPELLPLYVGKQYVVDDVNDKTGRLLAVRRVWRTSNSDATTSALYYAVDGTLYAAPTLAAVLRARMQRALSHVHSALRTLQRFTTFSVLDAYKWNAALSDPEGARNELQSSPIADDENSAVATLARARYFGRERTLAISLLDELKRHREAHPTTGATTQKRIREETDLPGRAKRPRLDAGE
jgi:hypothetical protein